MTTRFLLIILFGLCCPSLAFSTFSGAKSTSRQFGAVQSKLFIRGGDQESLPEQVAEAVISPEEEVVVKPAAPVAQETKDLKLSFAAVTAPMLSSITTFGKAYASSLEARPILTKSTTAGFIFALSDYLAQRFEADKEKENKTNWTRLMASAVVGFAYFGPAAHTWYETIFRLLPGTSLASTLQKAALGQMIFGPIFTCVFFASALFQSGNFTLSSWINKIKSDLPGAWVAGLGFWPLVDLVSYSMIAPQWIPLFVNMCSLVWTIYLSNIANRSRR
jgi:protein Mpv17